MSASSSKTSSRRKTREETRQLPTFFPMPLIRQSELQHSPRHHHEHRSSSGNVRNVDGEERRDSVTTISCSNQPLASSFGLTEKDIELSNLVDKRLKKQPAQVETDAEKFWNNMSKHSDIKNQVPSEKVNGEASSCGPTYHMFASSQHVISDDEGELNSHELDLLRFSAEGDIEGLKHLFEEQSYYLFYLNVNCVDSLDRSALSLATINNNIHVVKFLLDEDNGIKLGDALFYAIQSEYIEIIELLLEKDPQTSLQVLPGTTSPFEPGLTPFMMAAHKNNYKILALLYKYSHRLTFSENEFILDEGFDPYSWDAVMERLLHYKARASPAFMLLMYNEKGMSWDPLNSSMDLFNELSQLATREREVEETYVLMAEKCETFAMQLLEEVRSANELADLMHYDLDDDGSVSSNPGQNDDTDVAVVERGQKIRHYLKPIEKAVKYEMKDFVTSDNSQLALIYIQKGKLFRRLKGMKATAVQISLGCLFPFLSLALLLAPNSGPGKLMQNPTVKFWCWVLSEIMFIILLLANTVFMQYDVFHGTDEISPLLCAAYFWILGKFAQEVREIYHQGFRQYFSDIWNWNDMFTVILYSAFMLLRIIHIAQNPDNQFSRSSGKPWHTGMFDPLPLSDICIAGSYILIHMRIMELLRAERTFGPLQVSVDLMLHDAFRFSIVFCIVFLAFGSGITELYTPYALSKNCSCNETTGKECNVSLPLVQKWDTSNLTNSEKACVTCKSSQQDSLKMTNLLQTMDGFFWTLFGYGSPQLWYPINNCPEKFRLQEVAGGIIIGMYHFGAIILLVNVLIAMMSNSFQKTHDDAERQWKFHRTQLWLKFIRNEISRPPPMNLIPTWKQVKRIISLITKLIRSVSSRICRITSDMNDEFPEQNSTVSHIHLQRRRTGIEHMDTTTTLFEGEGRYTRVLRLVVLRYVKKKVLHGEMVI